MSATLLDSLANAAKVAIDAAEIAVDGMDLAVYAYEPDALSNFPAVTIIGPNAIQLNHQHEQRDSQLGSFDWIVDYRLTIYARMDNETFGQSDLRSVLGQVIAAIQDDPTLGGTAMLLAAVIDGEIDLEQETAQGRVATFTATLRAWALTAT